MRQKWGIRAALVAAGAVALVIGVVRGLVEFETSTVTVVTTPATSAPSPGPSPSPIVSPSAAPTSSTSTTTTSSTGSDTLEVALLGAAALFALMAVFYNRLSKVTLPGGIGFELTTDDAKRVSAKVAQRLGKTPVPQPTHDPTNLGPLPRVLVSAAHDNIHDPDPQGALTDALKSAGEATVLAARYAQDLLHLAGSEPLLRRRAAELGISPEHIQPLLRGEITDYVSDRIAERAIQDASVVH